MAALLIDSDSSDSDGEQMTQFLEAADTTLLTNDMFRASEDCRPAKINVNNDSISKRRAFKSNRYLIDEEVKSDADFITTQAIRNYIAKKFSDLIMNYVEFCDFETLRAEQKPSKNRVKLFTGAGCYVKSYEEFEFESKGPTKKPDIKRRKIDDPNQTAKREDLYRMAIVTSEDILSGQLTTGWAPKRERKDKIFYYKRDATGNLRLKPEENEFTEKRNKNQWNETKIKQNKKHISR